MSEGQLLVIAIGWVAAVTTGVAGMALSGKILLPSAVEAIRANGAEWKARAEASETALRASNEQAVALAVKTAEGNLKAAENQAVFAAALTEFSRIVAAERKA